MERFWIGKRLIGINGKIENLSHAIEQKVELSDACTEESFTKTQEIKLNSRERIKTHITAKKEFDH